MKPRKRFLTVGLPLVLLLAVGLLLASNQGFKVTFSLGAGENWIGLPYKSSLTNAADLYTKLGGAGAVASVGQYDPQADQVVLYTGGPENNFALTPGMGVIVEMISTVDLKVFGSHDPGLAITLLGPEGASSGTTQYAPPYNGAATKASELLDEIGVAAVSVLRYVNSSDEMQNYATGSGINFTLIEGESYRIKVNDSTTFVPKVRP